MRDVRCPILFLLFAYAVCLGAGTAVGRSGIPSIRNVALNMPRKPGKHTPRLEEPFARRLLLPMPSKVKRKTRKAFTRLTRSEGLELWVHELRLSKIGHKVDRASTVAVFVELGKAMLYSGCPDQTLAMFRAFREDNSTSTQSAALSSVVLRSMIAVGDTEGALSLLKECQSQTSTTIDDDALSFLISDLAKSSAEGLQGALEVRKSCFKQKGKQIKGHGVAGLIRGIWEHGLKPLRDSESGDRLLLREDAEERELFRESSRSFRLTGREAESLATEIFTELDVDSTFRRKASCELLRVAFRVGFEAERSLTIDRQALAGLGASTTLMARLGLPWDEHTTYVLVDECLTTGDLDAVHFLLARMNVLGIYSRTPMFNAVLRRYAEAGDADSALELYLEMADGPSHAAPDEESLELLLSACSLTTRGRLRARDLLLSVDSPAPGYMDASGSKFLGLSKAAMERWAEMQVLGFGGPLDKTAASTLGHSSGLLQVLDFMAKGANTQPTIETVLLLLAAHGKNGDWRGALALYAFQRRGDRAARDWATKVLYPPKVLDKGKALVPPPPPAALLPPVCRRTLRGLLSVLRDAGRYVEADIVLQEQPASLKVDETAFALTLEACVGTSTSSRFDEDIPEEATRRADKALSLFSTMERLNLQPDRRIYAALIRAFGLRGDVPSALGVFDEAVSKFAPDCSIVQSIVEVCLGPRAVDPTFARTLIFSLERLSAREEVDLNIFSDDILFGSFPDSRSLGSALAGMEVSSEVARRSAGLETILCSLETLGVLVRGVVNSQVQKQKQGSISPSFLAAVMRQIGGLGISPDIDTMKYFTIDAEPARNSPGSSHYNRLLRPNSLKQSSLLDQDQPEGLRSFGSTAKADQLGWAKQEPYFVPGGGKQFSRHVALLRASGGDGALGMGMDGGGDGEGMLADAGLELELELDLHMDGAVKKIDLGGFVSEEARLTLAEAALGWAEATTMDQFGAGSKSVDWTGVGAGTEAGKDEQELWRNQRSLKRRQRSKKGSDQGDVRGRNGGL